MFDRDKCDAYSLEHFIGASACPAHIYRNLKEALIGPDKHDAKIIEQKASLKSLARKKNKTGLITEEIMQEIIYLVDHAENDLWRPVIYVIPSSLVFNRLKPVPKKSTAGPGPEFIIEDLKKEEFDIIEA